MLLENTSIRTIFKLADAGEQAGFTAGQLIALLDAGLTAEMLLELIEGKLARPKLARPSVSAM
jgi:hypothetical protein